MMQDSYPFPVYSGVLNPTHYKHIDKAIWLFLWCISATTKDVEKDSVTLGVVLGGKPVQQEELAERFGVSVATVKRWIEKLEEHDYIQTKRAPYGLIFYVKNSKKFSFKNELSHERGSSNMNYQNDADSSKVIHLTSKSELSNKDIIKVLDVVVDESEIMSIASKVEQHFIQKRAKGHFISPTDFAEIKSIVADGIPLDVICSAIDKSFLEYKPKHQFDEIRTFSYCKPIIYSEWQRQKPSITGAVPHVPVALANGNVHKNRQQQAFDMLDQIAEE